MNSKSKPSNFRIFIIPGSLAKSSLQKKFPAVVGSCSSVTGEKFRARGFAPRSFHKWVSLPEGQRGRISFLAANFQFLDQCAVFLNVFPLQVFQQALALANHHEQAATSGVILFKGVEVGGQTLDSVGEKRDLAFYRAGVLFVFAKFLEDFFLFLDGKINSHFKISCAKNLQRLLCGPYSLDFQVFELEGAGLLPVLSR